MRVALAVAVLALLLGAAGCGGSGGPSKSSRRKAVTQYIVRVDTVEQQMREPLLEIAATYKTISSGGSTLQRAVPRFARAEKTIHMLRTGLAVIEAPPDAQKLRRLLLRFVDSESELAHELTTLSTFLPKFGVVMRPLAPADKRLRASLAAITVPKPKAVAKSQLKTARAAYQRAADAAAAQQALAIETYIGAVAKVKSRLEVLRPPPALTPSFRTQLLTLSRVVSAGEVLVTALRNKKYTQVAALDRRFQQAATTSSSLSAQKAQIAAVKAYNARVRASGALAVRVDAERTRLQKLLG